MANDPLPGFSPLIRELQALPIKLQNRVLRRSLAKAAIQLRNSAKAKAPVKSGVLKRNIIRENSSPRGSKGKYISSFSIGVEAGDLARANILKSASKKRIKSGEDPYYWIFQHKGWRAIGRKSTSHLGKGGKVKREQIRAGGRKIRGNPFLTDTLRQQENTIYRNIQTQLKAEIEKYDGGRN